MKRAGYRLYASEFILADDPIFLTQGNVDEVPVAKLEAETTNSYFVEIPLQRVNN